MVLYQPAKSYYSCLLPTLDRHTHPPLLELQEKKKTRPAGELMKSPQTRERLSSDDLLQKSLFFIDFGFLSSVLWFDLPLLFQHPLVDLALLILG
jgi:hypothetical protein